MNVVHKEEKKQDSFLSRYCLLWLASSLAYGDSFLFFEQEAFLSFFLVYVQHNPRSPISAAPACNRRRFGAHCCRPQSASNA